LRLQQLLSGVEETAQSIGAVDAIDSWSNQNGEK